MMDHTDSFFIKLVDVAVNSRLFIVVPDEMMFYTKLNFGTFIF